MLTIEGKQYTTKILHIYLQPERLSPIQQGIMVAFITFQSVLSNHYKCDFELRGTKFNCSEQARMYEKAKFFNDEETADKIMKSIDPAKQKGLGRNITDFDQARWNSNEIEFCMK